MRAITEKESDKIARSPTEILIMSVKTSMNPIPGNSKFNIASCKIYL